MVDEWVTEEFDNLELNDARLNLRLKNVLSQLARHPSFSIPAAWGGYNEMTAAYRLFDNPKVSFEQIMTAHVTSTRKRMAAQETVLLVQDTTEIDLTRPRQQVKGAGPLDGGPRRGMFLHLLHAFTPDGTPLGSVHAIDWTRDEKKKPCSACSSAELMATPFEQKESFRWLQTHQRAQQEAAHCPQTRFVCIGDSEADIYELLMDSSDIHWIIRASRNRALQPGSDQPATGLLREQVLATPVLYTETVDVRGRIKKVSGDKRARRQARCDRKISVEVRCARVTLRPPWRPEHKLSPASINVILVSETAPPDGEVPVEWILLTSLPVDDLDQIREVVAFYKIRWMIEVFFRVLKSGCRIEDRLFETITRLLNCLAIYLIVAWRTLYICQIAREWPDSDCEVIFGAEEWKSVWQVVHQSEPPTSPPTLGVMTGMVAQLGGYIPKKGSLPGPQTIWLGLQRAYDISICWKIFGPEARRDKRDV